jgi:hypothetical protein
VLLNPADWLPLVEEAKAMRTTGVYDQYFAAWYADALPQAQALVTHEFCHGATATAFSAERRRSLEAERGRLDDWLGQLAERIAPQRAAPALQLDLFAADAAPTAQPARAWQTLADPVERSAAFHNDRTAPPRLRGDAEHALRIYQQRCADLDARLALRPPEVLPLGVLMLLPANAEP